jgi:hypothetical protein
MFMLIDINHPDDLLNTFQARSLKEAIKHEAETMP